MTMIFDTQGTGFYKKAVREMMAEKEIPYLSGLGGQNGLGDEIMLLEGIEDLASDYPYGFDDGPARIYTMPTSDRATTYDFGSGRPVDTSVSGVRLGAPLGVLNQQAWPARGKPAFRYSGLDAQPWPAQKSHSYRYSGLGRPSYRYSGLGDAAADTAAAVTARSVCNAACLAVPGGGAPVCQAACESAYANAIAAINSGGCDAACVQTKLALIQQQPQMHGASASSVDAAQQQQQQQDAAASGDNTMLYVGIAAVLGIGLYYWMSEPKPEPMSF